MSWPVSYFSARCLAYSFVRIMYLCVFIPFFLLQAIEREQAERGNLHMEPVAAVAAAAAGNAAAAAVVDAAAAAAEKMSH
jgi:hypothetical protein